MSTMNIPERCTVLVCGGGPAGSYAACVLAREGIDTVIVEAEVMPRYHIGESMLPSFRHYLRFIELDSTFDSFGFTRKNGAAFKMTPNNREGYTDFIAAGGPENYSWNVIRSQADELMFRHAAKCGAKTFEGVKIASIAFEESKTNGKADATTAKEGSEPSPGRPVSATWQRKSDGATGTVKFDYIVDATGRAGLLNTKYLKNRTYNKSLKNVANWAYYKGAGLYGAGTKRAESPFFEALRDESGWAWFIPLHDGTHSIGVVMDQEISIKKKKEIGDLETYWTESLKLAPMLREFLGDAKRVTDIKSAADYSYHSSSYAIPNARVIGDAGCFIDPFFSSGVHLAVNGGLSAGTTIAASIRGDVDEATAASWHSNKTREAYARFCLTVLSAYKQMRNQDEHVLADFGEDNFDRAFSFFKPIIQGTADATNKLTQAEFAKTVSFLTKAFNPSFQPQPNDANIDNLPEEEVVAIQSIRMAHGKQTVTMEGFTTDVVDGLVPRLEKGSLTLVPVEAA